ncbi:MAG: Fur family transcriptional regulator, ferric uptake regulator [Chloroflexota bacterium]|nr:Fur family transcriptional regulator, ferric uptake regulator [Chloroflexota bacterium]
MPHLIRKAAQTLRSTGGRMTAQRRLILETLETLSSHPTAEEVYALVQERDPRLNPSTVYRTLAWLEGAGLVSHCHLDTGPDGEHSERYDPVTPVEHHHFICTRCGQVIEFSLPQIETIKAQFAMQHAVTVERAALSLYGTCASCRAGNQEPEAGGSQHDGV